MEEKIDILITKLENIEEKVKEISNNTDTVYDLFDVCSKLDIIIEKLEEK